MSIYLYKDGITHEVVNDREAARLKRLGYVEVKEPEPVAAESRPESPEPIKPAELKPAPKAGKK